MWWLHGMQQVTEELSFEKGVGRSIRSTLLHYQSIKCIKYGGNLLINMLLLLYSQIVCDME